MKKDRNQNSVAIKEAIEGYFKALGMEDKVHQTRILSLWASLMGEAVDKRTTHKYIHDRVLYLEINSSVMRDELRQAKREIIEKVNAAAGCELITDIFLK